MRMTKQCCPRVMAPQKWASTSHSYISSCAKTLSLPRPYVAVRPANPEPYWEFRRLEPTNHYGLEF